MSEIKGILVTEADMVEMFFEAAQLTIKRMTELAEDDRDREAPEIVKRIGAKALEELK